MSAPIATVLRMASNYDRLDAGQRALVDASVATYERVRPELKSITKDMLVTLIAMFKDSEVEPLFITGRTKTVESFREKISRLDPPSVPGEEPTLKFPDPFRTLNDMVGVRVITKLPAENTTAANIIKRQRQIFDCRGDREKAIGSIESGTYGYSSRHLILRTIHNDTVRAYQAAFNPELPANGSYFFECQIRTVFAHAWSEIEHDIRFKGQDPRAWSPQFDRQFTATAAMLEVVEKEFADLHDRYETVVSYWDASGEGAGPLTPDRIRDVWQTLLPHVDRKVDDDWGWAAELVAAHGLTETRQLVELLDAERITEVRKALDHRYSPGPDRLLDDLLLWVYGRTHIELTAEPADAEPHPRRDSLQRRLKQIERYRLT